MDPMDSRRRNGGANLMPIHEYLCPDCGKTMERLELSHSRVKKSIKCPTCGRKAKRIMSQGDFHLKGKWFKEGY